MSNGKGHYTKVRSKVKFLKNAPIEPKFTWNDPCDIINILKIKWRS